MTFEEISNIISKVSYKPEFKLKLTPTGLEVKHKTLDVNTRQPTVITHLNPFYMEAFRSEECVVHYVKLCLRTAEIHELDEWLTVNGKRLHDPHKV